MERFPSQEPRKPEYRTLSKKFTEELTELKCHHKDAQGNRCIKTFSQSNLPGIAECGHLACKAHQKYDGNLDISYIEFQCVENHEKGSYNERSYFLEDKLLEGGVKCVECKGVHPRHNAVRYIHDNKKPAFMCVWCAAATKETKMELIPIDVYEKNIFKIPAGRKNAGKIVPAESVNRDQKNAGWAMHMCCICEGDMFTDGKCKVCNKPNAFCVTLKKIDSKYLEYPKLGKLVSCEGECKQKHPRSNYPDVEEPASLYAKDWCVWCIVEKKIDDRKKALEEEARRRNERLNQ
ncbi:hypothetical protein PRIPAC_78510 [Pristionchus pacificus]|uniref:Uncharacterized protein n=1 Tax=Pristionchus pacificus TaxID=54126 RepID=A0A2A6CBW5_PRIPA|nr:hypothetical protein PRIPAC_78510 [Pristionchus pacificus]|eukprot:PDM75597.1 hypothetical protein PRIPAC_42774 [Pristionchus pacificus]